MNHVILKAFAISTNFLKRKSGEEVECVIAYKTTTHSASEMLGCEMGTKLPMPTRGQVVL